MEAILAELGLINPLAGSKAAVLLHALLAHSVCDLRTHACSLVYAPADDAHGAATSLV